MLLPRYSSSRTPAPPYMSPPPFYLPRFTSKLHHAQPRQQGDTQDSKMSSEKENPGIHKYDDVANSAFAAPDDNLAKYTSRLSRFMSKEQGVEKAAVADFDAKFETYERGNPYW